MPSTSTPVPVSPALAQYPSLRGMRVFITGGGSGIGAAMVQAFAEQGAQVAFVDFVKAESEALVQSIAAAGHPGPWFQLCDVRDVGALQAAILRLGASWRRSARGSPR